MNIKQDPPLFPVYQRYAHRTFIGTTAQQTTHLTHHITIINYTNCIGRCANNIINFIPTYRERQRATARLLVWRLGRAGAE